jgi:hypothetical protein
VPCPTEAASRNELERVLFAIWVSFEQRFHPARQRCLNLAAKSATLEQL